MKNTRSTNARRALRRDERERRVQAGKPSVRLDHRCPICKQWFSTYRNRHGIHRVHCEKKQARQRAAQKKKDKARVSLPPPDDFTPEPAIPISGPSIPPPPTPVPSIPEGTEQDQILNIQNDDGSDVVPRQPGDIIHVPPAIPNELPALNEAPASPAGNRDPGKFAGIGYCQHTYSRAHLDITTLDGESALQRDPGELGTTGEAGESVAQDPITWPLELGQTLVVYHPHAQRPPQVIPTRELSVFSRHPSVSDDPVDDTRPPYFPFKTLADFEQTELFIRRNCADPAINEQLDLWRRYAPDGAVTLKNAREIHKCLWAAGIEEDLSQVAPQSCVPSTSSLADFPSSRKSKFRFRTNTNEILRCGCTLFVFAQLWML